MGVGMSILGVWMESLPPVRCTKGKGEAMSIMCSWCSAWIRKETPVGAISHGICKTCAAKLAFDDEGMAVKPWTKH